MNIASLIFTCLFALALSGGSEQWVQEPTSGRWFKCLSFYNSDSMTFDFSTFEGAEQNCNAAGGRVLASIHSKEENDFIWNGVPCKAGPFGSPGVRNIGLRCVGAACKWSDGSPITYTNFYGDGPPDDGVTRCYTIYEEDDGQWKEYNTLKIHDCPNEDGDSWICGMPPQAECTEGETTHSNGCVSVHLIPLDYKSAEESCPGGGHLVSVHSYAENTFYTQLAKDAGINGTVYIGGQFSQGAFERTDGSHTDWTKWANSFPNTIYGSCSQMLLASDFGSHGQWTNVDCATKQPYMCFRDGAVYGPTVPPPAPHSDPTCPWLHYPQGKTGTAYSPNYPLSIPAKCYSYSTIIRTDAHTKATVRFVKYDCQSDTTLRLYEEPESMEPFATFTPDSPPNGTYSSSYHTMKIIFDTFESPVGIGWELEYFGT